MTLKPTNNGWIEVICGNMFSGKTEELLRRLRRAKIAKLSTIVFKPEIDKRYSENKIVSHIDNTMKSLSENSTFINISYHYINHISGFFKNLFTNSDTVFPFLVEQKRLIPVIPTKG